MAESKKEAMQFATYFPEPSKSENFPIELNEGIQFSLPFWLTWRLFYEILSRCTPDTAVSLSAILRKVEIDCH